MPVMRWLLVTASLSVLFLDGRYIPSPSKAFHQAYALYGRGDFEPALAEASRGYLTFKSRDAHWAAKFRLLEADILSSSNLREALAIYSDHSLRDADLDIEDTLHRDAAEAFLLVQESDLDQARLVLDRSSSTCEHGRYRGCGQILNEYGEIAAKQGRFTEAEGYYQKGLAYSRAIGDKGNEQSYFMGLTFVALQTGRFDDALKWADETYAVGVRDNDKDTMQAALGNRGEAYLGLGDLTRARRLLEEAEKLAPAAGDFSDEVKWLKSMANVDRSRRAFEQARSLLEQALSTADRLDDEPDIADVLTELVHLSIDMGDLAGAKRYLARVKPMVDTNGDRSHKAYVKLAEGRIAAIEHQYVLAVQLFGEVDTSADIQMSVQFEAEHQIAKLADAEGEDQTAASMYGKALRTFESSRDLIDTDGSRLSVVANAVSTYDDYIGFLLKRGKVKEALLIADQSRARTLAQGLTAPGEDGQSKATTATGDKPGGKSDAADKVNLTRDGIEAAKLSPVAVARKADATLLFYWLGEKESYLWAITPKGIQLFPLSSKAEIERRIARYRGALMGPEDPISAGNADGRALYAALVAPAKQLIDTQLAAKRPVMILADGALCQLNFATLIAPASGSEGREHYWIEDATVLSAPSLAMLASARPVKDASDGSLLLMGDAVSPDANYPQLAFAATEMQQIEKHFALDKRVVFAREQAVPAAYLESNPRKFAFIHFVSHGVASQTDPLDSAIILSRSRSANTVVAGSVQQQDGAASLASPEENSASRGGGTRAGQAGQVPGAGGEDDSFKLYARDIMQHPIDARLVTISACYGNGTRVYVGEGLVGLSWAFLHAGAHNAIGALWEASDRSTAMLMDSLYAGLAAGQPAEMALRNAQLQLLHSKSNFRKPFYWAPFQIYTRM